MLERYADDKRVSIISGRSHHAGLKFFDNQDYIFTRYAHTWGWATWKRCWDEFDIYAKDASEFLESGGGSNLFLTDEEAEYLNKRISSLNQGIEKEVTHSWDYQWYFTMIKNGALGIVPCKNLIKNVGLGNGTHTPASYKEITSDEIKFPLRHPKYITVNKEYENLHFKTHIRAKQSNILTMLF